MGYIALLVAAVAASDVLSPRNSLVRTSTPTDKESPSRRPTDSSSTPTPTPPYSSPGPSTGPPLSRSSDTRDTPMPPSTDTSTSSSDTSRPWSQPYRTRHLVRD